jgi:nitrite reductase/ring-hydroxylating ferredoxin subunit
MPGWMPATLFIRSMMAAEVITGPSQIRRYFDADRGVLQSKVFADPVIYKQEIDSIFRRSWLFLAPETWLCEPGNFVTTRMGESEVLVWRGDDFKLRVLENRCLAGHRPMSALPRGRADSLICSCHGWRYDNCGRLDSSPARRLFEVAKTDDYKGLVFANCDLAAETLDVWLGDFAWYLDLLLARGGGGVEVYGEEAVRWTVPANWKVPAQAFCGQAYPQISTEPGTENDADAFRSQLAPDYGFQVSTKIGAMAIVTPQQTQALSNSQLGQPRDDFFPTIGTLFPTLSFDWRTPSIHVWHPVGASKTEIHSYCMVEKNAPQHEKERARRAFQFMYGPAGILSQSEPEMWRSITERASRNRHVDLNFQMGLGRERRTNIAGSVGDLFSDSNARAFFSWWQQQLASPCDVQGQWLQI